ncbi:Polynucleotide adenylyltransferase region [Planctomycetales bacterium 10988]|nr:Polynucleotide adenylyltransferase region [Planctomycetales bacterium 10988]
MSASSKHQTPREFAVSVVRRLQEAGFQALFAGGCVRDFLLHLPPKDYDVATNARPDEVQKLFGKKRTLVIGAAFGVMMVRGPRSAGTVEVATFRQDAQYSDGRHPDAVHFSTAEEDAKRRDFTLNGMFYDPLTETIHDFVGGKDDIQKEILRAIGDPNERIHEDKLRMLRAVRFTARFGFQLDLQTAEAIRRHVREISIVSGERIQAEMRTMLLHPSRAEAIQLLRSMGLLQEVLPEAIIRGADSPTESFEMAWQATCNRLRLLHSPSFPLAMSILLFGSPSIEELKTREIEARLKQVIDRWKLSNQDADRIAWLLKHATAIEGARQQPWSKLQPILIHPGARELLDFHAVVKKEKGAPDLETPYCIERLSWPEERLNPPPLINGEDLIQHGVPRGKIYRTLLEAARAAQLDDEIKSKAEALALVDQIRFREDSR